MSASATILPPRPVTVHDQQFSIEEKATEMYGGAVHYWRLDRDRWSGILDTVKSMGFTTISIYIPWEVHEVERGRFDFSGNKDIDAFLTLIEDKGLSIIARPGPQINSELTWFGYPLRILADPQLQALNGQGTRAVLTQVPRPIPALSYAEDKFFAETALWYDAICPILARHAYPNGRLVAAQVDNEMAFFFHVNAYACDYSPASLAKYRSFLQGKYVTIEAVARAHGRPYGRFDEIDPPRRFEAVKKEDIPYYTDWIEYREVYLMDCLGRLGAMMRERGLQGIPLFHNYPHPLGPGGAASGFTTPFNLMGLEEKLDFVGFDIYSRKELYDHVKTIVSYVVGTSRFPYIPEFIAGVWPWYLNPGEIYDEEFVTKAALMHGIKGFSRYMLVERDRWLDSPIRRDGRVRSDHAVIFDRINDLLKRQHLVDFRRQADVLLLANRQYDRLEAASVLISFPGDFLETPSTFSEYPTFMTVSEQTLGFEEPIQVAKTDWFAAFFRGLSEAGYPFLLSDTALPFERWQRYKVVALSSFEFMESSLQRSLIRFAESGGIALLGPRLPALDELMWPDETLAAALRAAPAEPLTLDGVRVATIYRLGQGAIIHLTASVRMDSVLERVLGGRKLLRFRKNDLRLDAAIHVNPDEAGRVILFAANPTGESIHAEFGLDTPIASARELWEGREAQVQGGAIREEFPPYTIKIYECAL